MSVKEEEIMKVGLIPNKSFLCDETIVDYKFTYKNTDYKVDIYIAYEADGLNENIHVGVYNKTNRMNYHCDIRVYDIFRDPILLKLQENSNIYKMNIFFFYLLLKQSFLDKNCANVSVELEEINMNYMNNIKISSIGFLNFHIIRKFILIEENASNLLKQYLVFKISFKNKKLLHKFQINLSN